MHADLHAETVELCHAATGFYDEPEHTANDIFLGTRTKVVGLTRARQERLFDPGWVVGGGIWEKKKKKKR